MRKLVTSVALGIMVGASLASPVVAIEGPIEVPVVTPPPPKVEVPVVEVPKPVVPKTIVPIPDLKTILPVVGPNSLIPTDNTPFVHLDLLQKNAHLSPEELLAAANSKDERYAFTGVWLPFLEVAADSQADKNSYSPIAFTEPVANDTTEKPLVKKFGFAEYIERQRFSISELLDRLLNRSEAVFMPTKKADYSKIAVDNLLVRDGAVIVRAGRTPVTVTTQVNNEKVSTRLRGGALALISAFDKQTIVLNLTDNRLSAVVCSVPAHSGKTLPVSVPSGQIVEVYPIESKTVTNLVARRVLVNERTREDMGLLISDCNYVRTMNKFRLTPALPKRDMNRVLKTAAALAYVRRYPVTQAKPVKKEEPKSAPANDDTKTTSRKEST